MKFLVAYVTKMKSSMDELIKMSIVNVNKHNLKIIYLYFYSVCDMVKTSSSWTISF